MRLIDKDNIRYNEENIYIAVILSAESKVYKLYDTEYDYRFMSLKKSRTYFGISTNLKDLIHLATTGGGTVYEFSNPIKAYSFVVKTLRGIRDEKDKS